MANNGWKIVPLSELCDSDRGITYGIVKVGEFVSGGVPVIRGGDIRDNVVVFDDKKRVTEEVSNQFRRTILQGGEVVLNLIAEPGHSAIVPPELAGCNVSRDVAVIPLNSSVNHEYVNFFLKCPEAIHWLEARLQGSVTQKINLGTLKEIPVPIPSLPEQKAIAHILGTLDDKIELNRRMNETLEATARALFKSWFVDFDPVRAKIDGQKPLGMDEQTAKLFPDGFEDSEFGHVPSGWEVMAFNAVAELRTESVKPGNAQTKYWEHYSIPAFDEGKRPVIELGANIKSGKYSVPATSVLVSKLNPQFPRVWLPDVVDPAAAICSTEFMPFVPLEPQWRPFLFELTKSESFQGEILSRVTGTTGSRQRVKPKEIAGVQLLIPPRDLIECFSSHVGPLHDRELANIRESHSLATLRDTLLPKLLSGELRVGEAGKHVGKRKAVYHG